MHCETPQGEARASLTKLTLLEKNAKDQEESMKAIDVKLSLAIEAGMKNNASMSRMENILMQIVKGVNVDLPELTPPFADEAEINENDGTSDGGVRRSSGKLTGLVNSAKEASHSESLGFPPVTMEGGEHSEGSDRNPLAEPLQNDGNEATRSAGGAQVEEVVRISVTSTLNHKTERTAGCVQTGRDLCSQVLNDDTTTEARETGRIGDGKRPTRVPANSTVPSGNSPLKKAGMSSSSLELTQTRTCGNRRVNTRTSNAAANAVGDSSAATTSKRGRKQTSTVKKSNRKKQGVAGFFDMDVEESQVSVNVQLGVHAVQFAIKQCW